MKRPKKYTDIFLVIDTHNAKAMIGLTDGADFFVVEKWDADGRHSEQLLQKIRQLFTKSHFYLKNVKGIVVHTGPGSFTGLRVGITTANVLGYALQIPVFGVSTFDLFARSRAARQAVEKVNSSHIYLLIPGIHDTYYYGRFHKTKKGTLALDRTGNIHKDNLRRYIPRKSMIVVAKIKSALQEKLIKNFIHNIQAHRKNKRYTFSSNIITPFYIAKPHITKKSQ